MNFHPERDRRGFHGSLIPQRNENLMMRRRYRPWQVAIVLMSTTCALPPYRSALSDEHATTSVESASKRPNIVLIMVDDMGYGDLPAYGAKDVRTPNLDRFASQGVRLTNYYAAGAECTPTRTALLTGLYPQRIGGMECAIGTGNVGRYDDAIRLRETHDLGLPAEQSVLSSSLKNAGYQTAVFGKWHLGYEPKHHPLKHGFDQFFGFLGGYVDYYRHREFSDLGVLFEGRKPVETEGYMTKLITDRAVQFVDASSKDAPFFLYVAFSVPHFPFQPPGNDSGKMVAKEELTKGTRKNYVAMLKDMDREVGRLLSSLEKRGLTENTLVVFASDHGAIAPGSNAPFRGFKSGLFEGGIRTACMMRWPGHLPAGVVSDQPAITMDLTTSFIEAGNGKTPDGYRSDGVDIVQHLSNKKPIPQRTLAWRAKRGDRVWRAIRHDDWKLVTRLEEGKSEQWLFDLKNDSAEQVDQSEKSPQRKAELSKLLTDWEIETKSSR
ncbi:MAG: arylsulfatase A-like enzyme [Planctomycetaceae bacterium]|jgi:arylsulfatase A-like enzyme